jgi:hypothetical protein
MVQGVGVDKEYPSSPSSQPSPLKGEGGLGFLTLSQKETSPEGEEFLPSLRETLKSEECHEGF